MPEYRAYILDKSGRIFAPKIIISEETDEAAIETAKLALDGHSLDLWEGPRRVTTLLPGKPISDPRAG
jgi:hypothetical protein